ncbi:hypothetical protein, partial [Symbiopectobacterium sp.]|uniref:hypothetical protein n=1 Tax=Symbiopectobacterium sp. TaxID=2952789 RepID=UPI003F31E2A9
LRMVTWGVLMLIGLQKAVINSELQNTVKSRKKKNQVRNDGFITDQILHHTPRGAYTFLSRFTALPVVYKA